MAVMEGTHAPNTLVAAMGNVRTNMEARRKYRRYRTDPVGWMKDRLNMDLWSKQREVAASLVVNKQVAVKSGHGVGKMVRLFELLPTTSGYVTMGDVRPGDYVLDEMGQPTLVTFKSQIQTRPSYRFMFDDGTEIVSGDEHQWQVLDLRYRPRLRGTSQGPGVTDWRNHWDDRSAVVMTSEELFKEGVRTSYGQFRWRIPLAKPLQAPDADLPIDPYVLGLWLADGCKDSSSVTIGGTKLGVREFLPEHSFRQTGDDVYVIWLYGLNPTLRQLDVLGDKHIPMSYLRASESQRRALLAGIMDGDGFLMGKEAGGLVGIDLTNKRLADDLYELLMTLGCKVSRAEGVAAYTLDNERHETGTRYRMNWRPLENPFRVRGGEWFDNPAQRSRHTQRTIVDIQPVPGEPSACIQVDSPRSLYLVGKSFLPTHNTKLASLLVEWWIDVHAGEDVMVVTTAPSNDQVTGILWEYIRKSHNANKLTGTVTEDAKWKDDQRNIIGIGRKPADSAKGQNTFQGRHYKYTLVIVDEACGITKALFDAVNAIVTTPTCRILVIGNPTDPNTEFGRIFLSNAGDGDAAWAKHTISVLDNPNFTGEEVHPDIAAALTSKEWVQNLIDKRGKDSVDYKARVLGEFPDSAEDSLFPLPLLYRCVDLDLKSKTDDYCCIGVDVARYGSDRSSVVKVKGGVVEVLGTWRNKDGSEMANIVHQLALEHNAQEVRIDTTGVGVSVFDHIAPKATNFYEVAGMVGSARSPDITRWLNARAFWHDHVKQLMLKDRLKLPPTLHNEDGQTLFDELSGITYKMHLTYQSLQISSKEELRRGGMESPDISDALMYACAPIDMDNPLLGYDPGDVISLAAEDFVDEFSDLGFIISPV